jgi:hypothetical protein
MRGEREWNGSSGPPSEHIGVVVVSATDTVERAVRVLSGWSYLLGIHREDSLAARLRGERVSQDWSPGLKRWLARALQAAAFVAVRARCSRTALTGPRAASDLAGASRIGLASFRVRPRRWPL